MSFYLVIHTTVFVFITLCWFKLINYVVLVTENRQLLLIFRICDPGSQRYKYIQYTTVTHDVYLNNLHTSSELIVSPTNLKPILWIYNIDRGFRQYVCGTNAMYGDILHM